VDLCGHATLAAAFALLACGAGGADAGAPALVFATASGPLGVRALAGGALELDFPARPPAPFAAPDALFSALGLARADALFVGRARDVLVEVATAEQVRAVAPDFAALAKIDALCVVVSARTRLSGAGAVDVVSRVFCPGCGVPEDPVTGSAHCTVVPHFAAALDKRELVCEQASARGGIIAAALREGGARVALAGRATLYARGEIEAAMLAP